MWLKFKNGDADLNIALKDIDVSISEKDSVYYFKGQEAKILFSIKNWIIDFIKIKGEEEPYVIYYLIRDKIKDIMIANKLKNIAILHDDENNTFFDLLQDSKIIGSFFVQFVKEENKYNLGMLDI